MYFVPATADERADVAAFLIALARENGHDPKKIQSVLGKGFLVEFDPSGQGTVDESEVERFVKSEKAPETKYDSMEKLPKSEVTEDDEGVYLKALGKEVEEAPEHEHLPYREQVREWAKENGYEVGDRGAIKKTIVADYEKAMADEQNSEDGKE